MSHNGHEGRDGSGRRALATLVLLLMAGQVPAPTAGLPAASEWRNGNASAGYVMEAAGRATDPDGAKSGYPQLSPEALVAANPDLIFLANGAARQNNGDVAPHSTHLTGEIES